MAQLGSAPVWGTGGRRFKSCWLDHYYPGVAQLGRAPALGAGGHQFNPGHPDHVLLRSRPMAGHVILAHKMLVRYQPPHPLFT